MHSQGMTDAVMGGEAYARLLNDFIAAPDGTSVWQGVAEWEHHGMVVVVRVGDGPLTAMRPEFARWLAGECRDTDSMPPSMLSKASKLADLARHLDEGADEAEARRRERRH